MNNEKITTSTAKSGGRKFKNDIILILAFMLVVAALGLGIMLSGGEGDLVVVTVDKELYGKYPLSTDARIEIISSAGECTNILVIEDGVAYVESATCPDGICSSHRPVSRGGESIVCLPNRVVITVETKSDELTPDIIA